MIVKIKTHKRPKFDYVLRYMVEDKSRLLDNGKPFIITHNMKGKTIDGWVKQFRELEKGRTRKRRKDGIVLYHEILSWGRGEKNLTPEKLEKMIRQYIKLRNPNAGYVVCVHADKQHLHAHICTAAIDRSGKNMRLSRKDLADLKKNIQQYQEREFPELTKSLVRHGRKGKRISEKEQQYKRRTGKVSQRETVQDVVEACYRKSKSSDEFYVRLKERGLETYVRGGKIYGVITNGKRYRFNTICTAEMIRILNRTDDLKRLRKIQHGSLTKRRG